MKYLMYMYFYVGCVFIFAILFIYWDITKKRIIKWEEAPKRNQKLIKKNEKKINATIKTVGTIMCVFMVVSYYKLILDFPAFLMSNYCQVTGVIMHQEKMTKEDSLMRILMIEDVSSDEELEVLIWGMDECVIGDVITINILENSKMGYFIE